MRSRAARRCFAASAVFVRTRPVSVRARRAVVSAALLVLSVGATAAAGVSTNAIPDVPPPPTGWSVNGATQPIASGFELTRAGYLNEAGSAFWTNSVDLTAPLTISYDATMNGGGEVGADGLALVFADASHGGAPDVVGEDASALGYGGIPGVAVALDTYHNAGEPTGDFIGIANGLTTSGDPDYIVKNTDVPDLRAVPHHLQVDVSTNHLDVAIDGRTVLDADVASADPFLRRVHRRERWLHRQPHRHRHQRRQHLRHRVCRRRNSFGDDARDAADDRGVGFSAGGSAGGSGGDFCGARWE